MSDPCRHEHDVVTLEQIARYVLAEEAGGDCLLCGESAMYPDGPLYHEPGCLVGRYLDQQQATRAAEIETQPELPDLSESGKR